MLMEPFIVFAILIGLIPAIIASCKGRNFFLWWLYGAALFLIALIHSLFLSPNDNAKLANGMKKCPFCAEVIKPDAKVCRYCGRDLPKPELKIECPNCKAMVSIKYSYCKNCGNAMPNT